jgi:hypothetical protein
VGNGGNSIQIFASNGNTIGGATGRAGNAIAFNGASGILVDSGTGNAIRRNVIVGHDAGLGIELINWTAPLFKLGKLNRRKSLFFAPRSCLF